MNFNLFRKNVDELSSKSRILVGVVVLLSIIIAIEGWVIATQSTRVVIVPPYLNKQVRVGYADADSAYYESFGLYVAELVGNLTPGDAKYVADALGKLFGAGSYQSVKSKVMTSAEEEKADNANFTFSARKTIWQSANNTVFVEGVLHQINSSGETVEKLPYTFQMQVHIEAGQPVLSSFEPYPGPAHTIAWLMKNAPKVKAGGTN
ncbi:type IV conjugative transfer system protein TraE [Acidithiobacillus marinus]|uniref:Type IV conjugative transfer system protein TraE n=1 Tax=Acidithiobacillus marinus TaxID=187490 RepID=A0A2I1DPM9_9PROT|nr:type IV conjugative transfer system protein TraE [Acidithiobacillus marinus]PKY11831.1 type IV conjugative transfer system protein TraE [Acidithiobacillus marinus]